MSDPQFANTEIPRDRFGRPMILPPKGTKRVAYRRCTTFVGCLEDTYNLMNWKNRQVAYGMGQRKDLVLAAAAADPTDKKTLGNIADKATEAALASASATTGTALHALTERIDHGKELGYVPVEYEADIAAYQQATAAIEYTAIETFRIHDEWQVAGTADRIGKLHGRNHIMDIKTGSIEYGVHKMAMQLAMYARSTPYNIATDSRENDSEPIDLNYGVIIHLPAGQGRCDLYKIDILKGWGACLIANNVWSWRKTKNLTQPINPHEPPQPPPTWTSLAEQAATVEDLRLIWGRAKQCGQLSEELRALCTERSKQLAA